MGLYHRNGVWYARWYVGGRLQRRSLGTGNRAEAESIYRSITGKPLQRRTKQQRRRGKRATFDAQSPPTTFAELVERYIAFHSNGHSHLKRSSIEAYLVQLRRFRERWGRLGVDDLHERAIDEWCEDRNAGGLSNATLKAERQVLRVFLRWGRDRDFISRVPRIPQTHGVPKTKPRPLTESDLYTIFKEIGTSNKPQVRALESFCMVQLHCGLRREEARFLSWPDVDFDVGEVVVTNKPEAGFTIKDSEERAIRMNPLLYQYLNQLRQRRTDHGPWICVNERYAQWSLGVSKWMRQLFNDTGIGTQHGTSHRFRHTFATYLLRSGTDLATLRDLLGHSDISVTSRYLGASPKRAEAVAALAQLPGPEGEASDEPADIQPHIDLD